METKRKLHLVVVTPYGKFYEGNVDFVSVTCSDGERGLFPKAAPLVAALNPGSLRFQVEDEWSYAFSSKGYVQTGHNYVIVICNAAEWADEIDEERAQKHILKNKERLKEKSMGLFLSKIYEQSLKRNESRLKVKEQFLKLSESFSKERKAFGLKAQEAQERFTQTGELPL